MFDRTHPEIICSYAFVFWGIFFFFITVKDCCWTMIDTGILGFWRKRIQSVTREDGCSLRTFLKHKRHRESFGHTHLKGTDMYLFQFWFPQCVCPAVGLLGHKAVLFTIFKGISTLFSKVAVLICIPTKSAVESPFLHTHSSIYCLQTFGS